jgi:hypothetical protein
MQVLFILQYLRWARLLPSAFSTLQSASSITTSSFQLANLDCLLTANPETNAITRMTFYSLVLPAALSFAAMLVTLLTWAMGCLAITTRRWVSDPCHQTRSKYLQGLLHWVNSAVEGIATFAGTAPKLPRLKNFLSQRMVISGVVLAFTLYQPFTSTMLLILQCQRLEGPSNAIERYHQDTHSSWLQDNAATTAMGLWGKPAPSWQMETLW